MSRNALLLLSLLVTGCVAGPDRRAVLASLIGADEATVVQVLGVPNRTYATQGIKFLAFDERRTDVIPPPLSPFGWGWNYSYYGPYPATVLQYSCETTVQVVAGRMRSFDLRGNACG